MLSSWSRAAAAAATTGHYAPFSKRLLLTPAVRGAATPTQPAATTPAAGGVCRASTGQPTGGAYRAEKVTAAPMEVEVKLRLEGAAAHAKLQELLVPGHRATYQQENYFFDGSNGELNSRRVVLRVRFYNKDQKARLTLKGEQVLKDGIGTASEVEEPLDPVAARVFLEQPSALLDLDSDIIRGLKERYRLGGLVSLGGFTNIRQESSWRGHTLELDATTYPWGSLYELECETSQPEQLRQELEQWLQEAGVGYKYSTVSKFANFIKKTLE